MAIQSALPVTDTADPNEFVSIDSVVTSFIERVRTGASVSIDEFVARCPEYADELREVLPLVRAMEHEKTARLRQDGRLEADFLAAGRNLDGLELVRPLGEGGMGFVWEAREEMGRHVAVKVLRWKADLVPSIRDRFLREARIVAKLNHRHLLPIYRVGECDGLCYFVMPLVNGCGLNTIISSARDNVFRQELPLNRSFWAQWLRVAFALAKGLRHAHSHGVLHRDIKPSNVLVEPGPIIRLGDFGLASAEDDDRGEATVCGTIRFMPREQLDGEATEASDVYSLAITLAELATWRPMFFESSVKKLIRAVRTLDIPPLASIRPHVPKPINDLIYRATRPDVDERTPTAEQFLVELIHANRKLSQGSSAALD